MVDRDGPYGFLWHLRPDDRVTWWIGAIARESAQVEFTAGLILGAIDRAASGTIPTKDPTLGAVADRVKAAVERHRASCSAPDVALSVIAWAELVSGLAERRNRLMHDVIARGEDGLVSFGSPLALSENGERVTEDRLVSLFRDLEDRAFSGEELWTQVARAWRQDLSAEC